MKIKIIDLILLFILPLIFFLSGCKKDNPDTPANPPLVTFFKGADISFLPEMETFGTKFYNQEGQTGNLPDILKQNGVNTIRIRLWHTPANGHSGFEEVTAFAKEMKAKGFEIFITIHYSDTWADPGHQQKPSAWEGLPVSILGDSVYNYTKRVVKLLNPDIIEIGNEISNGFLWPEGKISNQANFVALLKKGIQGARDASAENKKILIHCATLDVADWFYTIMKNNAVDYDIIGLSYYPFWTKITPTQAIDQLNGLSTKFGKDAMIAEIAYPFTLDWNDYTNNIIGSQDQLLAGYPASFEGQKLILTELRKAMEKSDQLIGFCYWAPEWIAFKGPQSTSGSSWENMALFDFDNKALPALEAFR